VRIVESREGRRLVARQLLGRRIRNELEQMRGQRRLTARVERVAPDVDEREAREASPVVVTVSRSERRARLFIAGALRRSYRVAVGDPKYPTPLGRFNVQTMQEDPAWNVPQSEWAGELQGQTVPAGDPRNPLVARWVGFDGAVGFHGTKSVDSLGQAASHGCVRMSRRDVIDLYRQVDIGTPVLVGP
jgi:lipoprotein-anchoring transpeptidase ErfK/SrfK